MLSLSGYAFCIVTLLSSQPSFGFDRSYQGADLKKQLRINFPQHVDPGLEVPKFHEYYKWVVSGSIGKDQIYQNAVPLFSLPELREIGQIPIGTEIKLNSFSTAGGMIYYLIKIEEKSGFIHGSFISRATDKPRTSD